MLASANALHNLLSVSAALRPEAIAILDPPKTRMTYGALAEYSDEIARALIEHSVGSDRFVALFTQKSADAVAAMFGILKSGNAYIPLSPDFPKTRLLDILVDARPSALIADLALSDTVANILGNGWSSSCTMNNSLTLFRPREEGGFAGKGTAYCLYTSGSSGKPKGVVHTHESALAFIDWCSDEFPISASDRFSSCAPLHFDLSIYDIFVAIKHGAGIALFRADAIRNPVTLATDLRRLAVTIVYATPTLFRLLLNHGELKRDYAPRIACFAGEIFPTKQLKLLMELWPSTDFYNLYGPTETNVCSFHKVVRTDLDSDQVPIGRACSGDTLALLPVDGNRSAKTGELIVCGSSVMTAYWNAPALTTAAFVQSGGKSWYRTGDVVEEIAPGKYRYVGRRDRMVKRRGYRLELNEIELALARSGRLLEIAAVATISEDGGDVTVTCFYCAHDKVSTLDLRRQFVAVLPVYMMPDRFIQIDALPKTSTDKIDYLRLRDLVNVLAVQ